MTAIGSRWARSAGAYTPSSVDAIQPAGIGDAVGEELIVGVGEEPSVGEDDGLPRGVSVGDVPGVSEVVALGVALD
jgi:hypothetical protein